jgi:hypothetical protein
MSPRPALLAVLMALTLAACAGDIGPFAGAGGNRVEVGEDVFFIRQTGDRAVIRNFATGIGNQDRLLVNATIAIAQNSGCRIVTITQRPDLNTYDATLDCAA